MERRRFTAEFKREAVNLAGQEGGVPGEGGAGAGAEREHAGALGAPGEVGQVGDGPWQAPEDRAAAGDRAAPA